jgi:hypothetical protein
MQYSDVYPLKGWRPTHAKVSVLAKQLPVVAGVFVWMVVVEVSVVNGLGPAVLKKPP